ncbi:DNA/RNA non-specific endonuclease [Catenibacterium mitsuokai]|uniref:DNA/RNA non-specific endonuclease n=1 Tax=Catenibacterium mitsuokai TaxID=100886 RepID=UPI002E77D37C|nr:DNA/RNA non-specific endonuclease [Catenibacterium tridentinum]
MNKFTYENTPLGKKAYGYVTELGAVEVRNTYNQRKAGGEYRQKYDHGGHLIAHYFQGSSGYENLDAQNRNVNQIDQRHVEREVASYVQNPNNSVFYSVENYTPVGERPQATMINYSVTNEMTGEQINEHVSFQNESHELQQSWNEEVYENCCEIDESQNEGMSEDERMYADECCEYDMDY